MIIALINKKRASSTVEKMALNMVLVLHNIKRLLKQVRRQLLVIYPTYLRKNVSSNWKVVDVIHATRSILSYRYLSNKKPQHPAGVFRIGSLGITPVVPYSPCAYLCSYYCVELPVPDESIIGNCSQVV